MLKNKINQNFKTVFMQWIYSEKLYPFHMYNLMKLEACSEPCQTPKVDLFTITVFTTAFSH